MDKLHTKKKAWGTPRLVVYGDVQEITQTKYKTYGVGDDVVLCIADGPSIGSCPPGDACP